jgi:RNA polymerase sigma-70 factor (ECF subfamily)
VQDKSPDNKVRGTDEITWNKIKSGDETAFMQVYDANYKHLYLFGYSICQDADVVKDQIHDLFCEIWEKKASLATVYNIKSYLFTCLKRKIIKDIKLPLKPIPVQEESIPSIEELIIANQTEEINSVKLANAFKSLSPSQRQIMLLKYYDGLTYEEIAHQLNNKPRTVYNQVHDALKRLRSSFKLLF